MTATRSSPPVDAHAVALRVAEGHLRAQRWSDAAAAMATITPMDATTRLRLNLARNLAELQRHRPAVYQLLMSTPGKGEYQPVALPGGVISVVHKSTGTLMSVGNDPLAAAAQQLSRIARPLADGQAAGVLGLGDGYVLAALAQQSPSPANIALGLENAVLLFEPSVDAVTACLMVHDYTGPAGPIQQQRVHWYIGPAWRDAYRAAVRADLYLPPPQAALAVGASGNAVHKDIQAIVSELRTYDAQLAADAQAYYSQLQRSNLAAAFNEHPSSRPRVLLTTSRFTTVLRYAAADAAAAFDALGWDVRLSMEQHPWQRTSKTALRQHVATFKPDLVFVIDHLRSEYGDLYPLQLPYACWIQDDLSTLTTQTAGQSVGLRDFVLTVSSSMYQTHYAYPARQCITATKMTTKSRTFSSGALGSGALTSGVLTSGVLTSGVLTSGVLTSGGARLNSPDIVYVSHASKTPATLIAQIIDAFRDAPAFKPFIEHCGRQLQQLYSGGRAIHTMGQMHRLVRDAEHHTGQTITRDDVRDGLVRRLIHPLNNALYRQQMLQWTVTAAEAIGATLALHGHGWDAHPDFARFARGPVAYGPQLEALTRSAAVSLHVVPYFYLHQRLLDGLVAGGFFLIREHPSDTWRLRWKAFVDTHIPAGLDTLAAARAALSDADRATLDTLLAESHDTCMIHGYDNLANFRRLHAEGLSFLYEDLPRRDAVSFTDAAGLRGQLQRYLGDADLRRQIADTQRAWVERHYTYEAGLGRAIRRMGELIGSEMHEPVMTTSVKDVSW